MKSKRRSTTTNRRLKEQLEEPRFFLDRNIAGDKLLKAMRKDGYIVTPHHEMFKDDECDPWILYRCGREGLVVIAADDRFRRTWTHAAAIKLGQTAVFCFTENNHGPKAQAAALIKAHRRIRYSIATTRPPCYVMIHRDGSLRELPEMPEPSFHRFTHEKDWESYERAKREEDQIRKREEQTLAADREQEVVFKPPAVRGSRNGHPEGQAGTEEKASSKEAGKD